MIAGWGCFHTRQTGSLQHQYSDFIVSFERIKAVHQYLPHASFVELIYDYSDWCKDTHLTSGHINRKGSLTHGSTSVTRLQCLDLQWHWKSFLREFERTKVSTSRQTEPLYSLCLQMPAEHYQCCCHTRDLCFLQRVSWALLMHWVKSAGDVRSVVLKQHVKSPSVRRRSNSFLVNRHQRQFRGAMARYEPRSNTRVQRTITKSMWLN